MKKSLMIAITAALGLATVGCAQKSTKTEEEPEVKRLVLYYSQTGTTKAVAEVLQKELNADIEAIEIEEPYTGTYDETIARVQEERSNGIVPKIKGLKHNLKDYDVIFLGYPIWFGTYAPPIAGLVAAEDFTDMKVVPFCTFGSGGLESSTEELKANLPATEIADGFGIRTARMGVMSTELHRFLLEKGHILGEFEPLEDFSAQMPVTDEETEIFNAATSGYMFPLGTAVTCGHRNGYDGMEYMFVAQGTNPQGEEIFSTIYVNQPTNSSEPPVFTRVVR